MKRLPSHQFTPAGGAPYPFAIRSGMCYNLRMKNAGVPRHVIDAEPCCPLAHVAQRYRTLDWDEADWLRPPHGVAIVRIDADVCRIVERMTSPPRRRVRRQRPSNLGPTVHVFFYRVWEGGVMHEVEIWEPPNIERAYQLLWPGAPGDSLQVAGDRDRIAAAAAHLARLTPPTTRD